MRRAGLRHRFKEFDHSSSVIQMAWRIQCTPGFLFCFTSFFLCLTRLLMLIGILAVAQWELEHRAQSSKDLSKLIELNFQLFFGLLVKKRKIIIQFIDSIHRNII